MDTVTESRLHCHRGRRHRMVHRNSPSTGKAKKWTGETLGSGMIRDPVTISLTSPAAALES